MFGLGVLSVVKLKTCIFVSYCCFWVALVLWKKRAEVFFELCSSSQLIHVLCLCLLVGCFVGEQKVLDL